MTTTPPQPGTVGGYVRQLRNRHGDDLTELAGRLGVSKAMISRLEHGKVNLGYENADALATLYKLGDDERSTLLKLRERFRDANSTRTATAAQNLDSRLAALEADLRKLDELRDEVARLARANRDLAAGVRTLAEMSGVDPKTVLPADPEQQSTAL
jgi:transcriptional regulator with XRE-family HTH domain